MTLILCNAEEVILREIADPKATRKSIAQTYAYLLRQARHEEYDWHRINSAIGGRWGLRGLDCVKQLAWKLFEAEEV